jgi:hypothetical protein
MFVIGFYIKHKMFPCVYALMTKKTKEQYIEVLNALKLQLGADQMPRSVMTDFEIGEVEAFAEVFPEVEVSACLFHLAQSFLRRLKKLGLQRRFKELPVRKTFRWAISTAFLPPELVRRAMALIIDHSPEGMECKFFSYICNCHI